MSVSVEHSWEGKMWDWPLQHNDGVVLVKNDKNSFEVGLDAQYFTPSEIEVKVVGPLLEIHFEHKAREDTHGAITRSITRSYKLPEDVDAATLKSNLTPKGVLIITAAKKH